MCILYICMYVNYIYLQIFLNLQWCYISINPSSVEDKLKIHSIYLTYQISDISLSLWFLARDSVCGQETTGFVLEPWKMEQTAPFIPCSYHLLAAVFTSSSLHQGLTQLSSHPVSSSDPPAPLFASEILSTQREPRCLLPRWEKALAAPMSKSSQPASPSFTTLPASLHSSLLTRTFF